MDRPHTIMAAARFGSQKLRMNQCYKLDHIADAVHMKLQTNQQKSWVPFPALVDDPIYTGSRPRRL